MKFTAEENFTNNTFASNIVQIQDNNYYFKATLFNGDGDSVNIKFSSIEELKIVDDLKNIAHYGHILFENKLDVIESFEFLSNHNDGSKSRSFKPFVFRGDGRDFLSIDIYPQIKKDDIINQETSFAMQKNFGLSFIFSVYDYEDILTQNRETKFKKLYFWDYSYQILSERDSYFSTGKLSPGNSDTQRSVYTGDAIRNLLTSVFRDDINTKIQFDDTRWDTGIEKIFYSSPTSFKALDDLNYLVDLHTSNKNNDFSPCILRKERTGKWTLFPIVNYFKSAYYKGGNVLSDLGGGYFIENLVLGRLNTGDDRNDSPIRRPSVGLGTTNFPDYSIIEDFHLSNMSATDLQKELASHYVHNYDTKNKIFSVDSNRNNINDMLKVYNKFYVSTMKGRTGKSPSSNLPLNALRSEQRNIKNVYSPQTNENIRLNKGRNKMLMASLFLNTTISFKIRGSTRRQSGRFLSIDRSDSILDNKFDNKMCGIYMILSTEHLFIKGSYFNTLRCSKTYTAESQNLLQSIS